MTAEGDEPQPRSCNMSPCGWVTVDMWHGPAQQALSACCPSALRAVCDLRKPQERLQQGCMECG